MFNNKLSEHVERISNEKKDRFSLKCYSCSKIHPIDNYGKDFYYCISCNGLLEVQISSLSSDHYVRDIMSSKSRTLHRGVWKYLDLIPLWREENIVSMDEGETPLVKCNNLGGVLGLDSLYIKFEGLNPTGSFKDRGMTVGVSKAKELGFSRLICASTGNTSASLAAYSARARLSCTVLVPKGKIARGKVAQAMAYGAQLVLVEGNFDDCLNIAMEYSERDKMALLLNSLNPFRIEGQKSTSFEVTSQLGSMPGNIVLPMGNGGNISSIWKGFKEFNEFSLLEKGVSDASDQMTGLLPRMFGVQAEGAAPIVRAFLDGAESISPLRNPHTAASAINIGSPVNWKRALDAIRDSKGAANLVSDKEILSAQRLLASKEGLFVEPASAAPIALLVKISKREDSESRDHFNELKKSTTVCIATGNGLKDPDAVINERQDDQKGVQPLTIADADSLERVLLEEQLPN